MKQHFVEAEVTMTVKGSMVRRPTNRMWASIYVGLGLATRQDDVDADQPDAIEAPKQVGLLEAPRPASHRK